MSDRTGIEVDLHFPIVAAPVGNPVAAEGSLFHRYDTVVELDGVKHEYKGGAVHFLACPPGEHDISIYFLADGHAVRPLGNAHIGGKAARVTVHDGHVTHVSYDAKIGWKAGNAALTVFEE